MRLAKNCRAINDLNRLALQVVEGSRRTVHLGAGRRWFESSRPDHFWDL